MRVSVLASGSKGNSVFIEMDDTRLLVDAGVGVRRIERELAELSVPLESLDAVFVTHEHSDHVKGLATLLRHTDAPVYARPGTLRAMATGADVLPEERLFAVHDAVEVGPLRVSAFDIPHDAADPVGYEIAGSRKCTVATDLGYVTDTVRSAMEGADVLVFEANHDRQMLRQGPYPWPLKQRILGNRGHLANDEAGRALTSLKSRPKKIILAHLSETNNRPSIAEETVSRAFAEIGVTSLPLAVALQDEMVTA
ncbi:MAG: MBL fold metallo-hydrolase [Schwartzia sp.]|nr:MBL fold metallo-hydrolase [Schwartzia sp. (in: firmicutes)]